jgi:hypothetical protein
MWVIAVTKLAAGVVWAAAFAAAATALDLLRQIRDRLDRPGRDL